LHDRTVHPRPAHQVLRPAGHRERGGRAERQGECWNEKLFHGIFLTSKPMDEVRQRPSAQASGAAGPNGAKLANVEGWRGIKILASRRHNVRLRGRTVELESAKADIVFSRAEDFS